MAVTSIGFFLHLLLLAFSTSAADEMAVESATPPSRQRLSCEKELVLFTPCLPYVSDPPNNFTATATPECCSAISSAFDSGAGNCLCYLLRQPMFFGFPLDRSRIVSLSWLCTNQSRDGSLESICSPSELPELPPLRNTSITIPLDSGDGVAASPSPSVGLPPETTKTPSCSTDFPPERTVTSLPHPPPHPRSISFPTPTSSGTKRTFKTTSWFQSPVLIFIASYALRRYLPFQVLLILQVPTPVAQIGIAID